MSDGHGGAGALKKVLNVRDLTFMGIAAVVGAGIFSTIGQASYDGGPGISLLFILTAITCGFSALCYAEFASRVPIAGSAYTYAYVSFGELVAWIIGWALILEYAIGNIVVAISWSGYFNNLLVGFHIYIPGWLRIDPTTAKAGFLAAQGALGQKHALTDAMRAAVDTWNSAPMIGGVRVFLNIPAFFIVCLISAVTYVGIRESKKSTNLMVMFKIAVIILVIIVGFFFVKTDNWHPFLPHGFTGVLKGVSAVFYAYIGFDAISTTAEECRSPQRDLPKGMIYSLVICTVLYILIALVLTGMVNFSELNVTDPLAFVFNRVHQKWIGYIVSISAVVATTSVLLVFQLGQPRIWMSMSRDGLLPKAFWQDTSQIPDTLVLYDHHRDHRGGAFSFPGQRVDDAIDKHRDAICLCVGLGGVLILPRISNIGKTGFKLPYWNGRYIMPALYAVFIYFFWPHVHGILQDIMHEGLQEILLLVFVLLATILTVATIWKQFSLIPVLGVLFCAYLLVEIPAVAWRWFFVWMAIGLTIYFIYGYRKSKLN